jgi:hypothetical protein
MSALQLGIISDTRTTRRIKHTQQTQLTCARIFSTPACQAKYFRLKLPLQEIGLCAHCGTVRQPRTYMY